MPLPIGCAPGWAISASWLKTCPPGHAGVSRLTGASPPRMPPGHERSDAGGNGDADLGPRAVLEALRARRPPRKILIGPTTHRGTIRDILEGGKRADHPGQVRGGR